MRAQQLLSAPWGVGVGVVVDGKEDAAHLEGRAQHVGEGPAEPVAGVGPGELPAVQAVQRAGRGAELLVLGEAGVEERGGASVDGDLQEEGVLLHFWLTFKLDLAYLPFMFLFTFWLSDCHILSNLK